MLMIEKLSFKKPPLLMFVFPGQRVVMTKNRTTRGLTRTPKRLDHAIYCHGVIMVIFSITWPWQIFDQVFVEHLSHDQWFFGCKAKYVILSYDPFNAVISRHVLIARIITVIVIVITILTINIFEFSRVEMRSILVSYPPSANTLIKITTLVLFLRILTQFSFSDILFILYQS